LSRDGASPRYLSRGQFRTLAALAECLMGEDSLVPPDDIATRVDRYLAGFEARRKWLMKAALVGLEVYPLTYLRPPLRWMSVAKRRRFIRSRFEGDVARRRVGELRRWLAQGMIRLGQQVVYLGYYGDPRTHASVGYVPFSQRARFDPSLRPKHDRLHVERAADLPDGEIQADVAIIGSGAAGSVIGYRLAEANKRVVILERGHHVDPSEFTEDEPEMLMKLYRDGAVQLTRDFRLQVLQGMCVGGTTVINNAVSIETPPDVLATWEERLEGSFDADAFRRGFGVLRDLLDIRRQPEPILQPGASKFVDGVEALGLRATARRFSAVDANIHDCLGCGYCNIGCAYGRKLSMLDTLLPWAQERHGREALRVISECDAQGIDAGDGRVEGIECRSNGRRLRVRADRYVLAAGAINSSYLLGRSGLGGWRVGRGLCFNMGSPMTAEFDEELRSYDGLQISHVFEPGPGGPAVVMETWFNPVVSQALAMPGWFDEHRHNMTRYAHMTATGVLVGTEPNAVVRRALFGGADVVFDPTPEDLGRLLEGLKLAGRIYLRAGAKRVMPCTFAYHEYTKEEQLDELSEIVRDNSDIQLGTGHPQGGNALGLTPNDGVVDPRTFRVHGLDNLHLCDASVFPTSIGVNPQLTVMALAEYAAPRIEAGA
jgi:choline dehydrogenase-like flavoprotein